MRRCDDCEHREVVDCGPYDHMRMTYHDAYLFCKINWCKVESEDAKECEAFEDMEGEEE